ncbi:MAG: aldehyde dehydrogenase family protein [Bacteroidia bacterium]
MINLNPFPYINGNYCRNATGNELLVYNKYSGELMARVPQVSEKEIEPTIASSIKAFKELRTILPAKRIEILENLKLLLQQQKEEFAQLICSEAGKPHFYAKQEVERCLKTIQAGIRETGNASGESLNVLDDRKFAFTQRFATGPVLGITPFNFPLNLALHKIIPAIAVGTSIVLKAPPQAPLTLLKFAELITEAGAPSGTVNVLVCENSLAEKMVRDDRFSVLSFTGSDKVGWYLKSISGKKKVLLELGGNAPAIVDATANLHQAAQQIAYGAFLYAGQICISTQKIFVAEAVADNFRDLLLSETNAVKSGNPETDGVINGPLIDQTVVERTVNRIDEALRCGANLLSGGKILNAESRIFAPTIISHVDPALSLQKDEVFAPVAILETVRNTEHAVKLANNSRFGLQCGVFCSDTEVFKTAYHELEYAAVLLNSAPGFRLDHLPYGGIKDSGQGREGIRYAMQEYTESRLAII